MRRHRMLALASAGVLSAMALAPQVQALVIGDFEGTGSGDLDKWTAVNATSLTPVTGIGNTTGQYSLKVQVPQSFNQAILRSFAGSDPETVADRAALMSATQFSIDVTTRPEDFTLFNTTPQPPLNYVESWIKFENVVINGPGINWNQLPINEVNAWNEFQADGTIAEPGETGSDPAGPTTRHFTVSLGSVPWHLLTINPETGSPDWLQLIIITQSTNNFNGLTYYFDNIQINQVGSVATWLPDANGNWSNGANWSTGISPNDSSTTVNFFGAITAPRTVTVNAARTVAGMNFNNANTYTIGGTSLLTLTAATGNANIAVTAGSHIIACPITFGSDLNITVEGGATLSFTGNVTATGRSILKQGSGVVVFPYLRAAALQNVSNGVIISEKATPNSPSGTVVVGSLSIAGNLPYLDLTNNAMVVDYTAASPLNTIRDYILQGYNEGNGWVPLGITSSTANNPIASGPFAGKTPMLGFGEASAVGASTFAGQAVDSTAVLVRFTVGGDASLDGQIDITDLGLLATSWQTNAVWGGGDFNYDGFVDITDLGVLATNWQLGVGNPLGPDSFAAALASVGLGGVSVPEPAAAALAGLLLVAAAPRRARR